MVRDGRSFVADIWGKGKGGCERVCTGSFHEQRNITSHIAGHKVGLSLVGCLAVRRSLSGGTAHFPPGHTSRTKTKTTNVFFWCLVAYCLSPTGAHQPTKTRYPNVFVWSVVALVVCTELT